MSIDNILIAENIINQMSWYTTLGFELEFIIRKPDEDMVYDLLRDLESLDVTWVLAAEDDINIQDDQIGYELKSPIFMSGKRPDIRKISACINQYPLEVTSNCGFHIHAGLQTLDRCFWLPLAKHVFAAYSEIEDRLNYPDHRLKNETSMYQSLNDKFGMLATISAPNASQAILELEKKRDLELLGSNCHGVRAWRTNESFRTLELKSPPGTLCPIQIAAGLRLWNDLFGLGLNIADPSQSTPSAHEKQRHLNKIVHEYNTAITQSYTLDKTVQPAIPHSHATLENHN